MCPLNFFSRFGVTFGLVLVLTACAAPTPATIPTSAPPATLTEAPATPTAPATLAPIATPTVVVTATAALLPTPSPTATAISLTIVQTYTVQEGDSWWTLAVQFKLPTTVLWAANPTLDPNWLIPGDVVQIPDAASAALVPTGLPQPTDAQVGESGGLRLREKPSVEAPMLKLLAAYTWLDVIGRTKDSGWLEVKTAEGLQGWVAAPYVQVYVSLVEMPVTGEGVAVALEPTAVSGSGGGGDNDNGGGPTLDYRFIYNVSPNARAIFQRGQALGRRANVFSKVGDSISVSSVFLFPFGDGRYNLRAYAELQPTVDYFAGGVARDNLNSFANPSLAAKVGWRTGIVLNPDFADPAACLPGETPLACEYRVVQPSVALIMLGTNDVPGVTTVERYGNTMRAIIDYSIEQGVIPVISTIPPFHRDGEAAQLKAEAMNDMLLALSEEYDIPLWDYWGAMQGLPNQGMGGDGVHPSIAPAGYSADFKPAYLQYGMAVRNITALYALDAVWRVAIQP